MRVTTLTAVAIALAHSLIASAGIKYEADNGSWVKIGGRVQLQYHEQSPSDGPSTDEIILRRLRPYIQGSAGEDWYAKIQWDMGKGTIDLRDAYFAHTGWDGMTLYIGNYFTPFSRESLTSSKKQQLIERTLVGSHNYGVTDRQAGLHLEGEAGKVITWAASLAKGAVDPDNSRIDFDTVVSLDAGDDWSEGEMIVGRVDYHPLGIMSFDQGDFDGPLKMTVGASGYAWKNDGDNLDPTRDKKDLDETVGFEISAGLRGGGFSIDAELHHIEADLVEAGITDGLYEDSKATLESYAIEAGYMVVPETVEIVAGYENQDADTYAKAWTRTSVGANYFVDKHNIKYQLTYRMGENIDGENGSDLDEWFLQAQYVF